MADIPVAQGKRLTIQTDGEPRSVARPSSLRAVFGSDALNRGRGCVLSQSLHRARSDGLVVGAAARCPYPD